MSEIRSQEEPQPNIEQETPPEAEMPEDFVEPEGKSGKWGKPVKGEVEINGEKVEVSYREKVIELPEHRREETGIQRIRRRELLPPFPEGLYITQAERMAKNPRLRGYNMTEEFMNKPPYLPIYSSEKKFDEFYKFLSEGEYPCPGTWVHNIDYLEIVNNTGRPSESIAKFKKEGLYFQKIHNNYEFDFWTERKFQSQNGYTTPIFIFGNKNPNINEYFNSILANPKDESVSHNDLKDFLKRSSRGEEEIRFIGFGDSKKLTKNPIRWCHAECALVPTKRSLNVLFFETGDEDKKEEK
jgi:hypothetical protein